MQYNRRLYAALYTDVIDFPNLLLFIEIIYIVYIVFSTVHMEHLLLFN